jgi:hypothetical protein
MSDEREDLVIDLYKNQNKSIREIAKTVKMLFRDIGFILKNEGLNHGIATMGESLSNNEKFTPSSIFFESRSSSCSHYY